MDYLSKSQHYPNSRNQPGRSVKKRYETANYIDRPVFQQQRFHKTLRWNIEENTKSLKKDEFTASSINLNQRQFSKYQNKENKYQNYLTQLKNKSNGLKSHKTINYQFDQKDYNFTPNETPLFNIKDYKSSLNKSSKNIQYTARHEFDYNIKSPIKQEVSIKQFHIPQKTVFKSRSQKQIKINLQQSFKNVNKHEFTVQKDEHERVNLYATKRYQRAYDKCQIKEPLTLSVKSSKQIKDQFHRQPARKVNTYNQLQISKLDSSIHNRLYDHKYKYDKSDLSQTSKDFSKSSKKGKILLNDFELGKCKGQGAFGKVFIAIHKTTRMLVAIKQIPKQKIKYMIEQFITQIKIQMFLDHPNIVKLYGFFDDETSFYIIMQYMQGGNIWNAIKHKKKLNENQTVQKLKEICLGLKQMHQNNILHRDIKPQNIVLTNDVCKICDFGWAAVCTDRRTTYCGTLDYISPEIIGGEGYDDSVDIWCIGVLAYEMLCGKTPFYNINRKETMKKIMNVNYEYPPQISSKAKKFIDKILKKNPNQRLDINQVLKHQFLIK